MIVFEAAVVSFGARAPKIVVIAEFVGGGATFDFV